MGRRLSFILGGGGAAYLGGLLLELDGFGVHVHNLFILSGHELYKHVDYFCTFTNSRCTSNVTRCVHHMWQCTVDVQVLSSAECMTREMSCKILSGLCGIRSHMSASRILMAWGTSTRDMIYRILWYLVMLLSCWFVCEKQQFNQKYGGYIVFVERRG